MELKYIDPQEQEAYEEGYNACVHELLNELQDSKNKILNMMFDTERYTSQRRMLLACDKLLDIYTRHYGKKLVNRRRLLPSADIY